MRSVGFSEDKTPLHFIPIWMGKKEVRRLSRWIIKAIKTEGGVTFVLSEYCQGKSSILRLTGSKTQQGHPQ